MKKALSFAVALGLVAGMASTAAATDINGTSRIRAVRSNNTGASSAGAMVGIADDKVMDKVAHYDMRTRFMTTSQVADNVTVQTRITLLDTMLGANNINANVDRAWITIKDQPVTGGTWSYGRMPADWSKFFSYGGTKDRVKAIYSLGGGNKVGGFIQKSVEVNAADNDGDQDAYSLLYVGSAGDTKYKVIAIRTEDDQASAKTPGDDLVGLMIDANVVAKAGPATVEADLVYKGDDKFESANKKDQLGLQATATMSLGDGITGAAILAYGKDDFVADDDYTPSLLIGTSQVTGIVNFGDTQNSTATDSDSAYLVVAGANVKLSDASSITAGAGYYDMTSEVVGADGSKGLSMVEVDVAYNHNLAKNTDFKVGIGYGMPDNFTTADDDMYAMGWQITTKW